MNVIRSQRHKICTEEINKISPSASDVKRIMRENGIGILSYGFHQS